MHLTATVLLLNDTSDRLWLYRDKMGEYVNGLNRFELNQKWVLLRRRSKTDPHVKLPVVIAGKFDTPQMLAEDVFDLSNNPSRETERELVFGRCRSVSVGDIVIVKQDETSHPFLCMPVGWFPLQP